MTRAVTLVGAAVCAGAIGLAQSLPPVPAGGALAVAQHVTAVTDHGVAAGAAAHDVARAVAHVDEVVARVARILGKHARRQKREGEKRDD